MARRIAVLVLVFLLSVGMPTTGLVAEPSSATKPPKADDYEMLRILVDTLDQVERNYVKEVSRRELIEAAIKGILEELDPYSAYISPDELQRFQSTVDSEFGGIGILITVEGGVLKILSPLPGTPAYREGLLAGDRILQINGQSTEDVTLDEAVRLLNGEEGTQLSLTVIHPGKTEEEKITVTRQRIHIETVLGDRRKGDDSWEFMLDETRRIGYVRITAFSRDTARELRNVLVALEKRNLAGLILDLRFNPGGLLSSAIEVSDLFISEGRIVSTKGRNSPERTWDASEKGTFKGFPMVVLVNRYSASASEIVSACLQDHKRATIMGERTWGKGSVQNVIELEQRRSALKLTTASYLRPSGENIHRFPSAKQSDKWGVMPNENYRLRLDDEEMAALVHDRRKRDIVHPHARTGPQPENVSSQNKGGEAPLPGQLLPELPGPELVKPDLVDPTYGSDPAQPVQGTSNGTGKTEGPNGREPQPDNSFTESYESQLLDRQLQMAVDYLIGELIRAGDL